MLWFPSNMVVKEVLTICHIGHAEQRFFGLKDEKNAAYLAKMTAKSPNHIHFCLSNLTDRFKNKEFI